MLPAVPPDPYERVLMPQREFDAVDWYLHSRPPDEIPAPSLGAYLRLGLSQPELADRLRSVLAELTGFLTATGAVPTEAMLAVLGRTPRDIPWRRAPNRLVEGLRAGAVETLSVEYQNPAGEALLWWLTNAPGTPLDVSLTATASLWADPDAAATGLLDLVRSWAEPLRLVTAAVTYDRVLPGPTPWELWYSHPPRDAELRGYFWANLLTAPHLASLPRLDQDAAAAGIQVDRHAGTAMIRDPGPVTAFDDDRLAAMKALLAPALPDAGYLYYEGPPLRIIRDPGTAFRRIPPGAPGPHFTG
jgi:hypothetical protein